MADKIEGSVSYTIEIPVDGSDSIKGIDEIVKHLEQLEKAYGSLETKVNQIMGAAEQSAKSVEKGFRVTEKTFESFDNKFLSMLQRMQKSAGTTEVEIKDFVSSFDNLKNNLRTAGEAGKGVHEAFSAMNTLFNRTTLQLRENDTAFKNNRDAIKGVADVMRDMRQVDVQRIFPSSAQMDNLNNAFERTVERLQQVGASESYIKSVTDSFAQFEKRAEDGFDSTSQLTLVSRDLTNQFNLMRTAGEQYAKVQQNVTIALMKAENETNVLIASLREMGATEDQISGVSAALREYQTAMRDAGGDAVKTQAANLRFRNTVNETRSSIAQAKSQSDAYKQSVENLSKSFQIALGPLSGVASRVTSLGALFKANGLTIGVTVATITGLSVASYAMIRAGMELERQMGQLNSIIAITGRESEVTSRQLVMMARNVGEATLASTAEATKAITALTTMRGLDASMFEGILTAAQGMSEMFEGGIAENAKRIGKSLSDVTKAGEALGEVGIFLTETEKGVLSALQSTGRQADAQAIIMQKLATFQEAAAGSASGLAGTIDTLMERVGIYWQEVSFAANATSGFAKELAIVSDTVKLYTEEQTRLQTVASALGATMTLLGKLVGFVASNFDVFVIAMAGVGAAALGQSLVWLIGHMGKMTAALGVLTRGLFALTTGASAATAATMTLGTAFRVAFPLIGALVTVGYLAYEMFADLDETTYQYQRTMAEFEGKVVTANKAFDSQTEALLGVTEAQLSAAEAQRKLREEQAKSIKQVDFGEAFAKQIEKLEDAVFSSKGIDGWMARTFGDTKARIEAERTFIDIRASASNLFSLFREGRISVEQLNAELDKMISSGAVPDKALQAFFDLKSKLMESALVLNQLNREVADFGNTASGVQDVSKIFDGLRKGYADVLPVFGSFVQDLNDMLLVSSLTEERITALLGAYRTELQSAVDKIREAEGESEGYARAVRMMEDSLARAGLQLTNFKQRLEEIRFDKAISAVAGVADTLAVYDKYKTAGKDAADVLRDELSVTAKLAQVRKVLQDQSDEALVRAAQEVGLTTESTATRESLVAAILAQAEASYRADLAMKATSGSTKKSTDETKSLRDALKGLADDYRVAAQEYGAFASGGDEGLALVQSNIRIQETVEGITKSFDKLSAKQIDNIVAQWAVQFDELNLTGMSTEEIVRAVAEALEMKNVNLDKLKEAAGLFKSVSKESDDFIEKLKGGKSEFEGFLSGGSEGQDEARARNAAAKTASTFMENFKKMSEGEQAEVFAKWQKEFPDSFGKIGNYSGEAFSSALEGAFLDQERQLNLIARIEGISDAFTDVFSQSFQKMFADGINGFGDMLDGFKSLFMNMLAELIAQAAKNQIILPLVTGYQTGAADGGGIAGGLSGMASAAGSLGPGAIAAIGAAVTVAAVSSFNKSQDKKFEKLTAEYRQSVQSTGTVLGDINAKSDSIGNTLESIREYSEDVLSVNYGMYKALVDIRNGIQATATGFAREMANTGPLAEGTSARTSNFAKSLVMGGNAFGLTQLGIDEGTVMTALAGGVLGLGVDKLLGGVISDFLGGIVNSVSKAIYSKKREVVDTGIRFMGQSVADIMADGMVEALQYATIVTTRRTLGVKSSKTSEATDEIDSVLARQFGDIFIAGIDSLQEASEVFGMRLSDEFVKSLTIPLQNLSLKDLKGEELAAEIERFFSATLDNWAKSALGNIEATMGLDFEFLQRFQNEGEGAYQTMLRLAAETNQLSYNLERLGQSVGLAGAEMIVFTQELANIAGGFAELNTLQSTFFDQFFSKTRKIGVTVDGLARAFERVGVAVPLTREAFTQLVQSQDLLSESGQEAYVKLLQLAGAVDTYFDALENAEKKYRERTGGAVVTLTNDMNALNKEFMQLGVSAPQSSEQFKQLAESVDRSTEAGQALYAQLMTLSESFFAVQDAAEKIRSDELKRLEDLRNAIQQRYDAEVDGYKRIQKTLVDSYKQLGRVSKAPDLAFFDKQVEDAFAAFSMSGGLDEVANGVDRIQQAIQDRYDMELAYLEATRSETERLYGFQFASMEQLKRAAVELKNYVDSLKLSDVSPLTPTQRLQEAESQFERVLQRAAMGDADAISRLQGVAGSFLNEARDYFASSPDYTNIFNRVTSALLNISDEFAGMDIPLDPVERAIDNLNNRTQENLERLIALTEQIAGPTGSPTADLGVLDQLIESLKGVQGGSVQQIIDAVTNSGLFKEGGDFTAIAETLAKIEAVQTEIAQKEAQQVGGGAFLQIAAGIAQFTAMAESANNAMYRFLNEGNYEGAQASAQAFNVFQEQIEALRQQERELTASNNMVGEALFALYNQLGALKGDLSFYVDGSHAQGLASVPFDGYIAQLHRGEAVLTAEQAEALRQALNAGVSSEAIVAASNVNVDMSGSVTDSSQTGAVVSEIRNIMAEVVAISRRSEANSEASAEAAREAAEAAKEAAKAATMAVEVAKRTSEKVDVANRTQRILGKS